VATLVSYQANTKDKLSVDTVTSDMLTVDTITIQTACGLHVLFVDAIFHTKASINRFDQERPSFTSGKNLIFASQFF